MAKSAVCTFPLVWNCNQPRYKPGCAKVVFISNSSPATEVVADSGLVDSFLQANDVKNSVVIAVTARNVYFIVNNNLFIRAKEQVITEFFL